MKGTPSITRVAARYQQSKSIFDDLVREMESPTAELDHKRRFLLRILGERIKEWTRIYNEVRRNKDLEEWMLDSYTKELTK